MVTLSWVVAPCRLIRAEDGRIPNETNIVGNCSAHSQFHVTKVAQQVFYVTLHVTSNLTELHFQLDHSLQFYETNFM